MQVSQPVLDRMLRGLVLVRVLFWSGGGDVRNFLYSFYLRKD